MKSRKEEPKKPTKPLKAVHLAQYSARQIKEVLAAYKSLQRIEIAEHLMQMFSDIAEYYYTGNTTIYEAYRRREEALLKKYGEAFKPVVSKSFYMLFDFELVLTETGYYTDEEFNALEDQQNQLLPADIQHWTQAVKNYLYGELRIIYLEQEPEFEISASEELSGTQESVDKEMTEARRLLAVYFILKAGFNIEHNKTHSASAIARMSHLLLGKQFTNLQNSSIYAKYKKMPDYNTGSVLIKDLRYIRQHFEALDMKNVLDLIDVHIQTTIKELPLNERKKYS